MITGAGRRAELADNLAHVHERVRRAADAAGRDPRSITVVVITKTFPASDVRLLHELGVRDVGENRDQEAAPKAAECADLGLRWHFVGQLQRNKARSVAAYADVVHSVDRARLVPALDEARARADRPVALDALVQVDLSGDPGRGGAPPDEVAALADLVAATDHLRLVGIMAVAPLDAEPAAAFARLAQIAEQVRRDHPTAATISAGMSADLEEAVAAGATHLRVGSGILGRRPPAG